MSNDTTTSPAPWSPSPKLLLLFAAILVAGALSAVLSVANAPNVGAVNTRSGLGTQMPPTATGAPRFDLPLYEYDDFVERLDEGLLHPDELD